MIGVFAYWLGRRSKEQPVVRQYRGERKLGKRRAVTASLRFDIQYADRDGVVTERQIQPNAIAKVKDSDDVMIYAICSLRNDVRSFLSSRILRCVHVQTGEAVEDLGRFLQSRF